jgi:hypothetical protein
MPVGTKIREGRIMKSTLRSISKKLLTLEKERYQGNETVVDPETGFLITNLETEKIPILKYLKKMGFEVYWLCEKAGKQMAMIIDKVLYLCTNKKELVESRYKEINLQDFSMYVAYDDFIPDANSVKNKIEGISFKLDNGLEICWKRY